MSKFVCSLSLCVFLAFSTIATAQNLSPVGLWKTVDDKTGKPRSLILINESNGGYSAVIEKGLLANDTGEAICDKCTDSRKNQKIIGMAIAKGLKQNGNHYDGGEILDPENGKIYRCKMKLDESGNVLEVRGYIGISLLGRSQIWNRVE